jgi:hypothetical protein
MVTLHLLPNVNTIYTLHFMHFMVVIDLIFVIVVIFTAIRDSLFKLKTNEAALSKQVPDCASAFGQAWIRLTC